jgi:hypothetical protein
MRTLVSHLRHPGASVYCSFYMTQVKELHDYVKESEPEIRDKIARLTCQECIRLDEAVVCYHYDCYYASVVMAVSAVESRLHKLIEKKDKALYTSSFKTATLGRIIELFDDKHYKEQKYQAVKKILPKKHRRLLALLNQYRVFSAHTKNEEITAPIAGSVLNLAFALLMDPTLCPYSEKELACSRRDTTGSKSK